MFRYLRVDVLGDATRAPNRQPVVLAALIRAHPACGLMNTDPDPLLDLFMRLQCAVPPQVVRRDDVRGGATMHKDSSIGPLLARVDHQRKPQRGGADIGSFAAWTSRIDGLANSSPMQARANRYSLSARGVIVSMSTCPFPSQGKA